MDRRKFLSFLGLAPLAAKVAMSEELIGQLSSAYDYRFGNQNAWGISYLQIPEDTQGSWLGLSRTVYPGRLCVPSLCVPSLPTELGDSDSLSRFKKSIEAMRLLYDMPLPRGSAH